jgi:MarR family
MRNNSRVIVIGGTLGLMTDHSRERSSNWTLLTGHGHVLVEIARNPAARMRDLSVRAGITERAVQLIVADLEEAGYITRHRVGRRNHYVVNTASYFRHPSQDGHQVGPFLELLATASDASAQTGHAPESRDSHKNVRIPLRRGRGSDSDRRS